MRAPERSPSAWPPVSDYTVEPESGREMLDGEVREASPAGPNHSRQHNQVDFVLRAYTAQRWVERALHVASASELFDDD